MRWLVLASPVALSLLAAWLLSTGFFRLPDDVIFRRPPAWLLPVFVAVAALLAAPFFVGRPLLLIITYAVALVWGALLAFLDLELRLLPDVLTMGGYALFGILLLGCALVTGDWTALLRAAACAGIAVAVFTAVYLLSDLLTKVMGWGAGGLGLGDLKLAGVLGALLGWWSWFNGLMGLLTGFMIGGLVAVVLLVVRRADRTSHISYGPSLIIGSYLWCVLPPVG